MTQDQEQRIQTSDRAREQREGHSHTTQLTQLHHLFDSYHLGTNRALFFVLPRPYVDEETTGFVRGPRGIDGVQEIFLVVNQPEDMEELAVSARMDTGHYGETKKYIYDEKTIAVSGEKAEPKPPSKERYDSSIDSKTVRGKLSLKYHYDCYANIDKPSKTWAPKDNGLDGYVIDRARGNDGPGYDIIAYDELTHGPGIGYDISVDPNGEFMVIQTRAETTKCFFSHTTGAGIPAPDQKEKKYLSKGQANIKLRVFLRSNEKKKLAGTEKSLLITTRGVCCGVTFKDGDGNESIVETVDVSESLEEWRRKHGVAPKRVEQKSRAERRAEKVAEGVEEHLGEEVQTQMAFSDGATQAKGLTIHEANVLGTDITREALLRSASSSKRTVRARASTLSSGHMVREMHSRVLENPESRKRLSRPAAEVDGPLVWSFVEAMEADPEEITRADLVEMPTADLERLTGLDEATINRQKLALLGVTFKRAKSSRPRQEAVEQKRQGKGKRKAE